MVQHHYQYYSIATVKKLKHNRVLVKKLLRQTCPTRRANINIPRDHQSDACPYGCILATSGADTHTHTHKYGTQLVNEL